MFVIYLIRNIDKNRERAIIYCTSESRQAILSSGNGGVKINMTESGAVNVRRMMSSDIHAVLALDRRIGKGRGLVSYKDMATTDPGGPLDLSFVAEADGKIVGFILTRLVYLMIPFTEVCVMQALVVDPDYQRRGIGGKLVNVVLDYCHAEEINRVRALVEEGNEDLRRFVEQLGFRRSNIVNYDRTFER